MKNSLLLGTSNAGKLQEFLFYIEHFSLFENFQIHDLNEFKDLGEPIEDGKTFKKNAEIKSRYFLEKTNSLVLCDDSGFIVNQVAAISVGVVKGTPCIDLNYIEDSGAEVDCNVVMANDGQFIEFQSTGEEAKFSKQTILDFIELVESSMPEIFNTQNLAIEK